MQPATPSCIRDIDLLKRIIIIGKLRSSQLDVRVVRNLQSTGNWSGRELAGCRMMIDALGPHANLTGRHHCPLGSLRAQRACRCQA
eukprot:scaffold647951_cov52-Prasinocladus_malaysianus.AAC.3